jgi:hypothetical protein
MILTLAIAHMGRLLFRMSTFFSIGGLTVINQNNVTCPQDNVTVQMLNKYEM